MSPESISAIADSVTAIGTIFAVCIAYKSLHRLEKEFKAFSFTERSNIITYLNKLPDLKIEVERGYITGELLETKGKLAQEILDELDDLKLVMDIHFKSFDFNSYYGQCISGLQQVIANSKKVADNRTMYANGNKCGTSFLSDKIPKGYDTKSINAELDEHVNLLKSVYMSLRTLKRELFKFTHSSV